MSDAVEQAIQEVIAIAGSLNLPVEVDFPYDPNSDELPVVLVDTGEQEVLEEDGMPVEGWATYWRADPSFQVLIERHDPLEVQTELAEKWTQVREAIKGSRLLELIRPGTKPELRKAPVVIGDKPGIAGFEVSFVFEIERD